MAEKQNKWKHKFPKIRFCSQKTSLKSDEDPYATIQEVHRTTWASSESGIYTDSGGTMVGRALPNVKTDKRRTSEDATEDNGEESKALAKDKENDHNETEDEDDAIAYRGATSNYDIKNIDDHTNCKASPNLSNKTMQENSKQELSIEAPSTVHNELYSTGIDTTDALIIKGKQFTNRREGDVISVSKFPSSDRKGYLTTGTHYDNVNQNDAISVQAISNMLPKQILETSEDYLLLKNAQSGSCIEKVPATSDDSCTSLPEIHEEVIGYHKKMKVQLKEPPTRVKEFMKNFRHKRKCETFVVQPRDRQIFGLFNTSEDDVQSSTMLCYFPDSCVEFEQKITVARSKNINDFPNDIPQSSIRSDVIHMLPHGTKFNDYVFIRISLADCQDQNSLCLMYSDSASGTQSPVWETLTFNEPALDRPRWCFANNYLFLYIKHFCMFLVVDQQCQEVSQKQLKVTMSLEFLPQRNNSIQAQIDFDANDIKAGQEKEIPGVDVAPFTMYENNENVMVRLTPSDNWIFRQPKDCTKELSYSQLSQIELLGTKPRVKVYLRSAGASAEMQNQCIDMRLEVFQQNGMKPPCEITGFYSLDEICKTACNRASSEKIEKENTLNTGTEVSRSEVKAYSDPLPLTITPIVKKRVPDEHVEECNRAVAHELPCCGPLDEYTYNHQQGVLIPDEATQDALAALLDNDTHDWKILANECGAITKEIRNFPSPTKAILRMYAFMGQTCNWRRIISLLNNNLLAHAADTLSNWYSEQTLPKVSVV